jgi:hypothetical protein
MELIIPAHCMQTPCMGPFPLGCLMNKNLKIGSVTGRDARTAYLSFFLFLKNPTCLLHRRSRCLVGWIGVLQRKAWLLIGTIIPHTH